jgi:hypothetical protein
MNRQAVSRLAALSIAVALTTEGRALAEVVWKADFETNDISQFVGTMNATKDARKNIEIVTAPKQQGKYAAKMTIHPDDTFKARQMRVQFTHRPQRTEEGQDLFMSFYLRMDEAPLVRDNFAYWESDTSWKNVMTWWVAPKSADNPGGGTTINFGTGNLGPNQHWTADFSLKKWHQMVMHIHWSPDPQVGSIKLWFDGKVVVDIKAVTKPDKNPMFFQPGIHRADRSEAVDTIYFDNFIEADALADVMPVKSAKRR